jgi:predicted PurR-regulated permease PerM
MAIGFVPFLVFFMLMSKDHFHVATVRLFPKEHRILAHRTVGNISAMIRSYIVANVFLGLLNSGILILIFWILKIHYFYFIGPISGFVTLIPYLGVFLAPLPPLASGIDTLSRSGILTLLIAIVGLHVITINFIYPKVVGRRLRLNPLVVTLALLFWAWIWGAAGLILAIPLLGAAKIICDHIQPLRGVGSWLGETAVI